MAAMNGINFGNIPACLAELPQWVLWRIVERDGKKTKVPFQVTGAEAKSNDPATWYSLETVAKKLKMSPIYSGIGFCFSKDGGFVGVDLDGCRDKTTGEVSPWAKEIVLKMDTYAEVSPSGSGVKMFFRGKSPFDTGKKLELKTELSRGGKDAGIEIYDWGRYFAVTGLRLVGPSDPQERPAVLDWLKAKYWPVECPVVGGDFHAPESVIERARKYLVKLPPSVSGQGGHKAAFHAACILVLGFGLPRSEAAALLQEWNQTCQPPWCARDLDHKLTDAEKQSGQRNYLRNVNSQRWDDVKLPAYEMPKVKASPRKTTLVDSAKKYLSQLIDGKADLTKTGFPQLDDALAGGVERGELIIMAGRPSHGKSAVALQCVHHWSEMGLSCLIVSEEMSALALGKRTLQFVSEIPQEEWRGSPRLVEQYIGEYAENRKPVYIVESCGTCEVAVAEIEKAVAEHKIDVVIIDYAQLLRGKGKGRYEEITNTSIALREVTNRHRLITLMLCQLNRAVEGRKKFIPMLSDLRDSGQLEQDSDVIVFLVWPHRIDPKNDPYVYQLFVAKNRNRAIVEPAIVCRFEPSRQRIVAAKQEAPSMPNYEPAFQGGDF